MFHHGGRGGRAAAWPANRRAPLCAALALLAAIQTGFAQGPDPAEIQKAVSLAVSGDYSSALPVFRAELLKEPKDPLLNYYVGVTLYKLERAGASIPYFEKAVAENAPFPQAFRWLALAYLEEDRRQSAAETVKRGLERFPLNRDLKALASEMVGADALSRRY